jgi:hypothetical protein
MSHKRDLLAQLRRQLGFLQRSSASYDAGYLDEAIRIALTLRVLFHDTKNSRSLLRQLGRRDIQLLSSVEPFGPNVVYAQGMGKTVIHAAHSGSSGAFVPNLGPYEGAHLLSLDRWWQQVVLIQGGRQVQRVQLILAAANKDGGAHVDPALTPEYEALAAEGAFGHFHFKDALGERSWPVVNAHFVFLRQIGQEVLLSPELFAIAGTGDVAV